MLCATLTLRITDSAKPKIIAMKKLTTLIIILATGIIIANGQCTANYSYNGTTDTLTFSNLSIVSNAHYYWNFGDGSGSTATNPIHIFPDNGEYLVTLYGKDTVSNCVDVFESWILVTKPDTITCNLYFSDTIQNFSGTDFLMIYNLSSNCSWYYINCAAGPAFGGACDNGGNILLGWGSSLFLGRQQAYTADTINGYRIYKEYYRTLPYNYSSDTNYQSCSANFEVDINYQGTGALVTFTAMNRNATSYQWEVVGLGNPIYTTTPTTTQFYSYVSYEKYFPYLVVLRVNDTFNTCGDTVTQQILIRNPNYAFPSGVKELSATTFSFYPNSATNNLTIDFSETFSKAEIEIYNMLGEKVIATSSMEQKTNLDITILKAGVYVLQVTAGNKISRQKFIKR